MVMTFSTPTKLQPHSMFFQHVVYFPIPQVFSVVCIIVSFDSSFFKIHLKKLKYKLKHHDLCQTRARLSDQGLTALRVTSMVFNHKKKQQCNIWLKVTFSSSDEISELFSLLSSVSDSEVDFSSLSLASLSSSLSPDKKKHAKIKYFQSLFFRFLGPCCKLFDAWFVISAGERPYWGEGGGSEYPIFYQFLA